jgi:hypothetical protein
LSAARRAQAPFYVGFGAAKTLSQRYDAAWNALDKAVGDKTYSTNTYVLQKNKLNQIDLPVSTNWCLTRDEWNYSWDDPAPYFPKPSEGKSISRIGGSTTGAGKIYKSVDIRKPQSIESIDEAEFTKVSTEAFTKLLADPMSVNFPKKVLNAIKGLAELA